MTVDLPCYMSNTGDKQVIFVKKVMAFILFIHYNCICDRSQGIRGVSDAV